jgi:hypothetical protein
MKRPPDFELNVPPNAFFLRGQFRLSELEDARAAHLTAFRSAQNAPQLGTRERIGGPTYPSWSFDPIAFWMAWINRS